MAHSLDAVCDGIAEVGDIEDEFCGSQQDVNTMERGRSFSIAGELERSIKPIDSLASKYLRLNSARLQLASSPWSNGAVECLVGADAGDVCEGAAA